MKRIAQLTLLIFTAGLLSACLTAKKETPVLRMPKMPKVKIPLLSREAPIEATVDFTTQVGPIIERNCLACHGADNPRRGLNLETREAANSSWRGGPVIIPEHPERSMLLQVLLLASGNPNDPHKISATERFAIETWIKEGAYWPDGRLSPR
ncbi:MAG: hypothetical protein ACI8UO_001686 [Verrucomicrobiales bacterium]|jgi:hypothetical protein